MKDLEIYRQEWSLLLSSMQSSSECLNSSCMADTALSASCVPALKTWDSPWAETHMSLSQPAASCSCCGVELSKITNLWHPGHCWLWSAQLPLNLNLQNSTATKRLLRDRTSVTDQGPSQLFRSTVLVLNHTRPSFEKCLRGGWFTRLQLP